MQNFDWKGIKDTQYLKGTISALTRDEAAYKLKQDGVIITQLIKAVEANPSRDFLTGILNLNIKLSWTRRVKPVKIMIATKKLATMLRSGLAILPSLEMVRDQIDDKLLKKTMESVYKDVEAGSSLSNAFASHPDVFDAIYINLVRAGETSGRLDIFLDKLVLIIRKSIKIRKSINSALLYPTILLVVAGIVLGIMMVFVVPVFTKMFANIGSQLPAPTLMIVNMSDFLRDPFGGGLLCAMLILFVISFRIAVKKNQGVRELWHKLILRTPLIGGMVLDSNLAQISMVYGNLSNAGVPVIEALNITAESSKNEIVREGIQEAKRGVFSGRPLSELLGDIKIFPSTFHQLISVGEQTGNMGEMLQTLSEYYEEEFDSSVDKMSQMMEPIMICFLGSVIGFILVAMYLPMFKMGQVVTG
jgi:type IV pilus assembly protein PilC